MRMTNWYPFVSLLQLPFQKNKMAISIFEKAQRQLDGQLPFVLYNKPNESYVNGIFQKDNTLHFVADFTESGFVFAPFDGNKDIILIKSDEVLCENLKTERYPDSSIPASSENNDANTYKKMVSKAIDAINSQEMEKVVLSRKKEVKVSLSALEIFQRLLYEYEDAFCYLWYHPQVGTWLGATPEILVKSRGNTFVTMSLAGTQLVRKNEEIPNWSNKELHEQKLVTDYIEKALGEKTKDLKIGKLESIKAGNLWHLRTKISGTFEKEKIGGIIRCLHPTPAVCGIPKEKAKEFILENETYDRLFYTGYLGELNSRNELGRSSNPRNIENNVYRSILASTELFVNLRCMKLEGNMATLFVGGGITSDSNPKKEWEETENKSDTILRVLSH